MSARRQRDSGMTLVEVLVVLAVVGIAAGASVLSLSPPRGDATGAAARRLAAAIQAAADRSITTGAVTILAAAPGGYGIGPTHVDLPPGTHLATSVPAVRIAFDGQPFALVVERGSEHWTVAFDGMDAAATPGVMP